MLYRARRLSSSLTHFSDECDRFKIVFLRQVEEKKSQIVKRDGMLLFILQTQAVYKYICCRFNRLDSHPITIKLNGEN